MAEALALDSAARARLEEAAAVGRLRGAAAVVSRSTPDRLVHLPHFVTSFHGRQAELGTLDHLISSRRLVTLLGPGGVGKTRLALEAARAQGTSGRFADGVWFADLAPLEAADLIATAIARLLAVRERPDQSILQTLVTEIATKKLLIVLDNCEHLLSECARVAEALLRDCPGVVILATTRESLRVDGECVFRVSPLSYQDEHGGGPAFELFVDRLIDADYARFAAMSSEDSAHAVTICRRLDGLPLALELAAGGARDLPLANIVLRLDERFALLASGRRTAQPRQQTLRGMIDWSFALLAPNEQRLFARLGLFGAAFSPEAAREICSDDGASVHNALEELSAKSLAIVIEEPGGAVRYRLLETIRAYALDRLREGGEYDRYARRFAEYFLERAKAADSRYGRIANAEFLALVKPDLDHFRAALEWALGRRNDVALGTDLAGAMGWIYRQTSLFAEGIRWTERALAEVAAESHVIEGRLHMALSFLSFNVGGMQRALDAAAQAIACYRKAPAPSELCWALTQQVYCSYMLGNLDGMRTAATEAVEIARRQGDTFRLAGALNALAMTVPIESASERFAPLEESIRCYRASGDEGAIVPTANLAEANYATGNFASALSLGLELVAMTRKNHDRSNLASALSNVAAYALTVGDLAQADVAAREALGLVRDLGKTLITMCALQHLGTVAARSADHVRAARLLGASDELYREFGLTREFTERALYERTLELIRTGLGCAALAEHLTAGASLPLADAVGEALSPHCGQGNAPTGPVAVAENVYEPSP